MEGREGKVFEYLRENSSLDLEVPDIAFNVKKSEKTVEAALVKLQQKGLVTARQNEFGRVYWYALPSAPATKPFNIDDASSPMEGSLKTNDSMDDEVDLSELTAKAPPAAPGRKKSRKNEPLAADLLKETLPPPRNTAKINVVPASPSPRQVAPPPPAQAPKADDVAPPKAAASAKVPLPPPTASMAEMDNFEAKASHGAVGTSSSAEEEPPAAAGRPDVNSIRLTAALAVAAAAMLLAIVAYFGGMGISSKMLALRADIAKKYVTVEELATVKAEAAKTAQLETKVAQLSAQVENLKKQVQTPPPEPVKKPMTKGFYRRR